MSRNRETEKEREREKEKGKKLKHREEGNKFSGPEEFTKEFIFTYLIEMVDEYFSTQKKKKKKYNVDINCWCY